MKNRFLANTPLFAVLSEEERQALAERFALRQFADGAALFRQGESVEGMLLVKSGMVRLTEQQQGAERMLGNFGPSSVMGEIGLLLNSPHASTAVAQGPVDAWLLTRGALAEAMTVHPAMSIKLSTFLGERIVDIDQYLIDRLRQLSILAELDEAAFRALAQALTLQSVKRGALIFQAGVSADHLYFVESGTVTIVSTSADDPTPFRQMGPGEVFGHEALLRNRPYGAVARAATDVQLWALARADFERLTTLHPALRRILAAHVSEQGFASADRMAARHALNAVPIFASLSPDLLDIIVARMTLRHAGTNETIFTAGDPGDAFYLVDKGVVKLLDDATLMERKEEGEFFGEMALLTGKPRSLTARAVRPTNLWMLAKNDFDLIAMRYPELTTAVSQVLSQVLARETSREATDENLSMYPLFTGLTPKEQADVARRVRAMQVANNEVIFRRGAVADAFYLVKRGQIRLVNEQGIFDMVREGGFFGEMALLTGNNHNMTAQAVEDSDLLLLDRSQFDAVVRRYASVALLLSRALSSRLEAANARGTLGLPSGGAGETATRQLPAAPPPRGSAGPTRPMPVAEYPTAMGAGLGGRPPRSRSPWTLAKLLVVLVPLMWLSGIVAPTMLLEAAADDSSPFHSLLLIGVSPTPVPTLPAPLTLPPTPTVVPGATTEPTRPPRPEPTRATSPSPVSTP